MLRKLLGIDVKMRQYAEGRKFVHAVVERVGMDGFNKIWQSPLTIPRLDELGDPDAWVVRVHGASALSRPVVVPPVTRAATATTVPSPAASPAKAGVVEAPPAPVPTVPEPVGDGAAEAGVAEATEVAGLSVEEVTATAPVTTATTTVAPAAEQAAVGPPRPSGEPPQKLSRGRRGRRACRGGAAGGEGGRGDEVDGTQERPAKPDATG